MSNFSCFLRHPIDSPDPADVRIVPLVWIPTPRKDTNIRWVGPAVRHEHLLGRVGHPQRNGTNIRRVWKSRPAARTSAGSGTGSKAPNIRQNRNGHQCSVNIRWVGPHNIRQIGTSVRSGKSGFLLPHALFWFSTLLFRIENPYTQWVWIANPDQRHAAEHPLGRGIRRVGLSLVTSFFFYITKNENQYDHYANQDKPPCHKKVI